jgi:hypothetical protein
MGEGTSAATARKSGDQRAGCRRELRRPDRGATAATSVASPT